MNECSPEGMVFRGLTYVYAIGHAVTPNPTKLSSESTADMENGNVLTVRIKGPEMRVKYCIFDGFTGVFREGPFVCSEIGCCTVFT
jgi:hypothetical protein